MQLTLLIAVLAPFLELFARVAADPNASQNSLIRLPMKNHIKSHHPGSFNPAQMDLARVTNLVGGAKRRHSSPLHEIKNAPLSVNYTASAIYVASVGIGNPPTFCESCQFLFSIASNMLVLDDLIVDTGSSNTWVGGNKHYKVTNTSVKTSNGMVSIDSCTDSLSSSK